MAKKFGGFSREMGTFFRGLEKNNDRAWFGARKELFEARVRGPMVELVGRVNEAMKMISVDHVAEEPGRLLYRIYRDTRFSKDKTPYKTHLGATFPHRVLTRHGGAGFYFEVSHRYVGVAGGVYMPGPEELAAIRGAIAEKAEEFCAVVEDKRVAKMFGALQGERLARLPKGFEKAAGRGVEYLKFKQFYFWVELPAELAGTGKLEGAIVKHFAALGDFLGWMNGAILAKREEEERKLRPVRPEGMW